MELSREKKSILENTLNLLMNQWNDLDECLGDCVLEGGDVKIKKGARENEIAMKVRVLEAKKNEMALKRKEFEAKKTERQKWLEAKEKSLDQRSMEIHSRENVLSIREAEMISEMKGIIFEEADLHLGEKKLKDREQTLHSKMMMLGLKMGSSPGGNSGAAESPVEMKKAELKRARTNYELDSFGMEVGENSRARPKVPRLSHTRNEQRFGSMRNDVQQNMVQGERGLVFLLTMTHSHKGIPFHFISAFDLIGKKHVILLSDEGSFQLDVKYYNSKSVLFRHGWGKFYLKNRLSTGMQCLFQLKERSMNGDASVFSMDVSILGR